MQIWEALDRLAVLAARLDEGDNNKRLREESERQRNGREQPKNARQEVNSDVWNEFVRLCSGEIERLWYLRFTLSEFDAIASGTLENLIVSGVFNGNVLLIRVSVDRGVIILRENGSSVASGLTPSAAFGFLEKKYDEWSREGQQLRTWDEFTYLAGNESYDGISMWQLTARGVADPGNAGVVDGSYMYAGNVGNLVLRLAVVVENGVGKIQTSFDSFGGGRVQVIVRGCRKVGTPREVFQFLNSLYPRRPEELVVSPGSPVHAPTSPPGSP